MKTSKNKIQHLCNIIKNYSNNLERIKLFTDYLLPIVNEKDNEIFNYNFQKFKK